MSSLGTKGLWPSTRLAPAEPVRVSVAVPVQAVPDPPARTGRIRWQTRPAQCAARPPMQALQWRWLRWWCLLMSGAVALALSSTGARAWTPFERKTLYEEVELSPAEAKKIQFAAGWSAQSDTELLIEVKNNLPGPLACLGATVHLQGGSAVSKSFLPRLYVPNGASRQGAVGGVKKGQMKDFSITCHCWKKPGDSACGNPASK